jgi:hypothetical protein
MENYIQCCGEINGVLQPGSDRSKSPNFVNFWSIDFIETMTGSTGTGQGQPQQRLRPRNGNDVNVPSSLLANAENEALFAIIGSRSVASLSYLVL